MACSLDLDGIDGLLHITDMTWKRISHPSEMVKIGDKLKVIILSVDREKGRVALGLKQKESNPWDEIEKHYPPGTKVHGKIVNLLPYGAFIEIEARYRRTNPCFGNVLGKKHNRSKRSG